MSGYGNVFMLCGLILANHGLMCSLRYIDYRDRFYVWVMSLLVGAVDLVAAFMLIIINAGQSIPFNFSWYVGGIACGSAVAGYIMNFKFKARRKKDKEKKVGKHTS